MCQPIPYVVKILRVPTTNDFLYVIFKQVVFSLFGSRSNRKTFPDIINLENAVENDLYVQDFGSQRPTTEGHIPER